MASLGRMLQVVVVVLGVAAMVHSQVIEIGACRNYQSSNRFSKAFIEKMININESYGIILTTDNALPCQQLRLFSNGTFLYTYATSSQDIEEFTGPFTAKTSSFSEAGYLDLVMPSGVFGNGLLGNLRLYVLMATDDYLVVASCWPLAIIRVENIHAMVPNSKFDLNTPTNLNKTLEKHGVPHVNRLKEVAQLCEGTIPEPVIKEYVNQRQELPGNITILNMELVNKEVQEPVCVEGGFIDIGTCTQYLMLSDAVALVLFRTPFPICRPIYREIFSTFCTYLPAADKGGVFIREDSEVEPIAHNLPKFSSMRLPTTSNVHPSLLYSMGSESGFSSFAVPLFYSSLPLNTMHGPAHFQNPLFENNIRFQTSYDVFG